MNGDRMSTTYEKIEKLESALQVLRADLLRMRKDLIEVKREFSSEKDFEKLVREASNLISKGKDIDPTTLIREMRDKDYDWWKRAHVRYLCNHKRDDPSQEKRWKRNERIRKFKTATTYMKFLFSDKIVGFIPSAVLIEVSAVGARLTGSKKFLDKSCRKDRRNLYSPLWWRDFR
jgi:hypothetical protein